MYTRILCPLDGSKTAESVLPFARLFARNLQIPVELLAVVDVVNMMRTVYAAESLFMDSLVEDETRRLDEYLNDIGKNFPAGTVQSRVQKGSPAEVIVEEVLLEKDALIAMATHGRSGLNRWLLGSVAEKVLRGASNPLLLVRAKESAPQWRMPALKSIVVPLDGSETAETVLPSAAILAKRLDLDLILLRVYGIPYRAYAYPGDEGFYDAAQLEKFTASLRAEASAYLEEKAKALRDRGVQRISIILKEGLDADEIISLARQTPDNVIAMCTHGRSGVKRWTLGSVTETVVRHSGDPVLVVRAT
jgi:nucleotide-binding universal stress UspA family protein